MGFTVFQYDRPAPMTVSTAKRKDKSGTYQRSSSSIAFLLFNVNRVIVLDTTVMSTIAATTIFAGCPLFKCLRNCVLLGWLAVATTVVFGGACCSHHGFEYDMIRQS